MSAEALSESDRSAFRLAVACSNHRAPMSPPRRDAGRRGRRRRARDPRRRQDRTAVGFSNEAKLAAYLVEALEEGPSNSKSKPWRRTIPAASPEPEKGRGPSPKPIARRAAERHSCWRALSGSRGRAGPAATIRWSLQLFRYLFERGMSTHWRAAGSKARPQELIAANPLWRRAAKQQKRYVRRAAALGQNATFAREVRARRPPKRKGATRFRCASSSPGSTAGSTSGTHAPKMRERILDGRA